MWLLSSIGAGAAAKQLNIDTFFANGTWTSPALFWSPAGVLNEATVECWGAGGGGTTNVGGGGGGAYCTTPNVSLSVSTGYTVTVGTSAVNADGGSTTFNSTTVVAVGGLSGTNGGTGGAAASCTGTTAYSGGNGGVGTGTQSGGGSAGDSAAGGTATPGATNGGYAQAGGGSRTPGGGGRSQTGAGTTGQAGQSRVTYQVPVVPGFAYTTGRSWGRDTADATSRNITLPPGSGGLLVLIVAADDSPTISATGWTALTPVSDGSSSTTGAFLYRTATGSDPVALATSGSESLSWVCLRILGPTGGVPGTPEWTTASNTTGNADPPSHTPSGGSNNYLWLAVAGLDLGNNVTALPASFGNALSEPAFSTSAAHIIVCERKVAGSVLDPASFTSGSGNWVAGTVSIGPA